MWKRKKEIASDIHVFSSKDAQFSQMEKFEAFSNENGFFPEDFKSLQIWINKHAGTSERIVIFRSNNIEKDEFLEIKKKTIKSQIVQGLQLIQSIESDERDITPHKNDKTSSFPFPQIKTNFSARLLWRNINIFDISIFELKKMYGNDIKERMKDKKVILANLISLLTTSDVVPNDCIPVVDFSELKMNIDDIIQSMPVCESIKKKVKAMEEQMTNFNTSLKGIMHLYGDRSGDWAKAQVTQFHKMLNELRLEADEKSFWIPQGESIDKFHDFVLHPNNIIYEKSEKFIEKNTKESYWLLVRSMISMFNIEEKDVMLINAICASAIAPIALPDIKFDGAGTDDLEALQKAIELIGATNPLHGLLLVDEFGVETSVAILQILTSNWKFVLSYFFNFTDSENIPKTLINTRNSIDEIVNKK